MLKVNTSSAVSSPLCQKVTGNINLKLSVSYSKKAINRNGFAYAVLSNPSNGVPPVMTLLNQLGESDVMAFSKYYSPLKPFKVKKQMGYIYGIYMDHCSDGSDQGGVQMSFNQKDQSISCMFTTPQWNNCRF